MPTFTKLAKTAGEHFCKTCNKAIRVGVLVVNRTSTGGQYDNRYYHQACYTRKGFEPSISALRQGRKKRTGWQGNDGTIQTRTPRSRW